MDLATIQWATILMDSTVGTTVIIHTDITIPTATMDGTMVGTMAGTMATPDGATMETLGHILAV